MYTLITKRTGWDMFWPVVPYKGLQTWAVDLLPPNNQFDWVDPDLVSPRSPLFPSLAISRALCL